MWMEGVARRWERKEKRTESNRGLDVEQPMAGF